MTKKKIIGGPYYYLFFGLIALMLFIEESISLYKDYEALNWPTTTGTLYVNHVPQGIGHTDSYTGPITEPLWRRVVSFSYSINGFTYESDRVSFGFTLSEKYRLENDKIDDRSKVTIYFNPQRYNEAILIPGPKVLNVLLIVISLAVLLLTFRQLKKNDDAQQINRAASE